MTEDERNNIRLMIMAALAHGMLSNDASRLNQLVDTSSVTVEKLRLAADNLIAQSDSLS